MKIKNFLAIMFIMILIIGLIGCPSDVKEEDKESPPVLFSMSGTFTATSGSGVSGLIKSLIVYENNTFKGSWVTTDTLSLNSSGTYNLSGTALTMTGSGTAYAGSESSFYTFELEGTVNGANADGEWEIVFTNPLFDDDFGTWICSNVTPPYVP